MGEFWKNNSQMKISGNSPGFREVITSWIQEAHVNTL